MNEALAERSAVKVNFDADAPSTAAAIFPVDSGGDDRVTGRQVRF
jgi:hypothetical protein